MKLGGLTSLLVAGALAACATGTGSSPAGARVVASIPSLDCAELGMITARAATELLTPRDVLMASATARVRAGASQRGATHVVVREPFLTASVSYTTTATATGLALRCPP